MEKQLQNSWQLGTFFCGSLFSDPHFSALREIVPLLSGSKKRKTFCNKGPAWGPRRDRANRSLFGLSQNWSQTPEPMGLDQWGFQTQKITFPHFLSLSPFFKTLQGMKRSLFHLSLFITFPFIIRFDLPISIYRGDENVTLNHLVVVFFSMGGMPCPYFIK